MTLRTARDNNEDNKRRGLSGKDFPDVAEIFYIRPNNVIALCLARAFSLPPSLSLSLSLSLCLFLYRL
jgi:hypothetical protein